MYTKCIHLMYLFNFLTKFKVSQGAEKKCTPNSGEKKYEFFSVVRCEVIFLYKC